MNITAHWNQNFHEDKRAKFSYSRYHIFSPFRCNICLLLVIVVFSFVFTLPSFLCYSILRGSLRCPLCLPPRPMDSLLYYSLWFFRFVLYSLFVLILIPKSVYFFHASSLVYGSSVGANRIVTLDDKFDALNTPLANGIAGSRISMVPVHSSHYHY